MSSAARVRRAYFDCRYGQLHVHQAIPPGGGFDEAAPLLCIPGRQGSGRFFQSLLGPVGADRSIYAPDLPGYGESDSASGAAGADQYALACIDLLDSLRQRQVDILAVAEGVDTAAAIERLRPSSLVRRLACIAATPQSVSAVRSLKMQFRELSLDVAPGDPARAAPSASQLSEIIEFFGSAVKA